MLFIFAVFQKRFLPIKVHQYSWSLVAFERLKQKIKLKKFRIRSFSVLYIFVLSAEKRKDRTEKNTYCVTLQNTIEQNMQQKLISLLIYNWLKQIQNNTLFILKITHPSTTYKFISTYFIKYFLKETLKHTNIYVRGLCEKTLQWVSIHAERTPDVKNTSSCVRSHKLLLWIWKIRIICTTAFS